MGGDPGGRIGWVVVEADNRNDGIQRLPVSSIEGQGPGQGDGFPRVRSKTIPGLENLVVVRIRTVPPEDDSDPVGRSEGRCVRDVDIESRGEGVEAGNRLHRDYDILGEVDVPELRVARPQRMRWVKRKAIKPSEAEVGNNPASRSAQLRVLERVGSKEAG